MLGCRQHSAFLIWKCWLCGERDVQIAFTEIFRNVLAVPEQSICICSLLCGVCVISKCYFECIVWMSGCCYLGYSLLLIHGKSTDYIDCVKLYFASDEEGLFWECLLWCRSCLVCLVPSSKAVGNISKVTLPRLPVQNIQLLISCTAVFPVPENMWTFLCGDHIEVLHVEARVLHFALLYCILACHLVFKWAVVFKHVQRWNSLQAVTLTFESVGN